MPSVGEDQDCHSGSQEDLRGPLGVVLSKGQLDLSRAGDSLTLPLGQAGGSPKRLVYLGTQAQSGAQVGFPQCDQQNQSMGLCW